MVKRQFLNFTYICKMQKIKFKIIIRLTLLFILLSLEPLLYANDSLYRQETQNLIPPRPPIQKRTIQLRGYMDIFYATNFRNNLNPENSPYFVSHNRNNQFNLNLGMLEVKYNSMSTRAVLALHGGTYAFDNYTNEPGYLRIFNQAFVGVKLHSKVWLDAGIFDSYIGMESAVNTENLTYSRSFIADNSPYYFTGLKFNYLHSSRLSLKLIVSNGWQRISPKDNRAIPSFGTALTYNSIKGNEFNWSTYLGENNDSIGAFRPPVVVFFNNFYYKWNFSDKWKLWSGIDIGVTDLFFSRLARQRPYWIGGAMILQYQWNEKWHTALRAEHYNDPQGTMTQSINGYRLQASGFSLNQDYTIDDAKIRFEVKYLTNPNPVFRTENGFSNNSLMFMAGIVMAIK